MTTAEVAATRARPLRRLSADDLYPVISRALSTWGDEAELKHFLPRALELIAREEIDECAVAWTFLNKIGRILRDWPLDERAAIHTFTEAWWRATLSAYPRRWSVLDVLELIGALEVPIAPYLAHWETRRSEAAARHLAWLIQDFAVGSAADGEWYRVLEGWIDCPAVVRLLEAASAVASTPGVAAEFSRAREIHDLWQARGPESRA
ncbi:hypothetical protein [Actinoallomurus sp. CA-150999]|uniref:hypothetical protein n=1 Tax=Actinoallomurus sp. CA-150999 TaxID=3239887 RepID=UPI003D94855B